MEKKINAKTAKSLAIKNNRRNVWKGIKTAAERGNLETDFLKSMIDSELIEELEQEGFKIIFSSYETLEVCIVSWR